MKALIQVAESQLSSVSSWWIEMERTVRYLNMDTNPINSNSVFMT
jgi:hypothetical protein